MSILAATAILSERTRSDAAFVPQAPPEPVTTRDRAVDLVRAGLLCIVIALHALMVGVARDADGAPILVNAMDGWGGFGVLTWFVQIMPLFFVLGGFSARVHWTRRRAAGDGWEAYLAARMRRLLVPGALAVTAVAVFVSALSLSPAGSDITEIAGFRIGQPFWFLGVYVGVTALVPVMTWLHERHRVVTFAALAAGVVAVDVVRIVTGIDAIGLANMAFVWLLMQQLGFALADGTFDRLSGRARAVFGGGALASAVVLSAILGVPDLIAALNPPMGVLVLLGVAQLMLFVAVRPALRRVADRPRVARVVDAIGARSMTVYAWHMLVTVALAGLLLLLPIELPALLSAHWWVTRPVWFLTVGIAVALVVRVAGRAEVRREDAPARVSGPRATTAVVLGMTAIVLVLAMGANPAAWTLAAAALWFTLHRVVPRA